MTRPNILLILTDQHRYDIIGANGSTVCRSPNIDRLAAAGVNFQQAYSVCGLCSPSRASMYTGLLPHRHGIRRNIESMQRGITIPPDVPTLAERLNGHGYRSHFIGKWHAATQLPTERGFTGMDVSGYGVIRKHPDYLDYLSRKGLDVPQATPAGVGWAHNLCLAGVTSGPVEASIPYYLAQRTIEYLERAGARDEPFFLALNFWGPHAPYFPCEPYASMYDPADIPPWGNFDDDFAGKPPIYRRYRDAFIGEGNPPRTWEECARWAALYYGFATQIDDQIGRVLDALERLGIDENTAVVFSADHGDMCGAHGGMHDKGGMLTQEVYHVPLMARVPGSPARGVTTDAYCSNLDLAATVLDLAGYPIPDGLDSRSLLPLMRGEAPADWPDHVVAEYFGHHFTYEARMVVHAGHKYVYHPGSFDELYDLAVDPWELHNLIDSPARRDVLRACRLRLIDWMKATGEDLTVICGLFEAREPVAPETIAPYDPTAAARLRGRRTRLIG